MYYQDSFFSVFDKKLLNNFAVFFRVWRKIVKHFLPILIKIVKFFTNSRQKLWTKNHIFVLWQICAEVERKQHICSISAHICDTTKIWFFVHNFWREFVKNLTILMRIGKKCLTIFRQTRKKTAKLFNNFSSNAEKNCPDQYNSDTLARVTFWPETLWPECHFGQFFLIPWGGTKGKNLKKKGKIGYQKITNFLKRKTFSKT